MSDEEFFAFLDACRKELAEKQPRFQQRIEGASRWSYDLANGSLTVGVERFPITPIGTHSPQHQSWLWAWANQEFPPLARVGAKSLQSLYQLTGFRIFIEPGIGVSGADAQDLAGLAVHQLGAIGFFRSLSDGPTLYLAVHEPEP
jgi:hypothetical protein